MEIIVNYCQLCSIIRSIEKKWISYCLFRAFTRPRYQVSVYWTIGPQVSSSFLQEIKIDLTLQTNILIAAFANTGYP